MLRGECGICCNFWKDLSAKLRKLGQWLLGIRTFRYWPVLFCNHYRLPCTARVSEADGICQ